MKVHSFATIRAPALVLAACMSCAGCGGGGSGAAVPAALSTLATSEFQAALMGGEEVPPNASAASGTGGINIDTSTHVVSTTVATAGIAGTAASIREAPLGAAGPVVVPLIQTAPGSNVWTAVTELTPDQFDALFDDNLYFEVQSNAFPNGEIRGQIILVAVPTATGGTTATGTPAAPAGGTTGTTGPGVPGGSAGGSAMGTAMAAPGTAPVMPGIGPASSGSTISGAGTTTIPTTP